MRGSAISFFFFFCQQGSLHRRMGLALGGGCSGGGGRCYCYNSLVWYGIAPFNYAEKKERERKKGGNILIISHLPIFLIFLNELLNICTVT